MADFLEEEEQPQRESTPTFTQILQRAQRAMASEMRVSMPGEIVSYDHKSQKATVRPYFQRKYNDGRVEDPPLIHDVPVWHPRAGNSFVHVPVKPGHVVQLVFSDRSMDKWLTSGKQTEPGDTRMHHISDAVAYPGGYPFSSNAGVANGDDVIVKNDQHEIRVKPNGHIQFLNSSQELMKVLEEWMTASISGSMNWKIRIREKLRTFVEK